MTFSSSAISSSLFCRRPAVSMMRTSAPVSFAAFSASKARPAASAPCSPATTVAPVRPPQIFSCSMAAARKVSPAASTTLLPSSRSFAASLPIVVVLPVPLTPTTRTTCGFNAGSTANGWRDRLKAFCRSRRLTPASLPASVISLSKRPVRRVAIIAFGSLGAEVGANQHVLKIGDRRCVELSAREDRGDAFRQGA